MKFNFGSKTRKSIYEMEKWTNEDWKDLEDFLLPILKQILPQKKMNDREYAIYKDVFNPNESDFDYFIRRGLELGTLTKEDAENMRNGIITKEIKGVLENE